LAFSVRGLEPDTHYTLLVTGSSTVGPDFTTDARGAYKSAGGTYDNYLVNGAHFNNTNTISVALFLYNAGQPPIVTGERIANRCRAS
jgi:hypothetical protein